MNRIAAFFGHATTSSPDAVVNAMLDALRGQIHNQSRSAEVRYYGPTAMGSIGGTRDAHGETERYSVVLQGRFYNRDEFGGGPPDLSDAQAFADLVTRIGFDAALKTANGDFAVVCHDKTTRISCIARDRVGVRPLFYVATPNGVGAASRLVSLLPLNGVSRTANKAFVARFAGLHYRTFDNLPEESPFADISQLPAAHILEVRDGSVINVRRYWQLANTPMFMKSEAELAATYQDLLLDAVGRRARKADAPAFTLSGGMDSSSVLACAVRTLGQKQQAYSTVYTDATFDESAEIMSMLDSTVAHWNTVSIDSPDVLGTVARMVKVHDEPVATATWLSHFILCEQAGGAGVQSLFGGLGGDELNAGEYEYFMLFFADLIAAKRQDVLATEIESWVQHHDHPIYRKSREVVDKRLSELVDLTHPGLCKPDRERLQRYRGTVSRDFEDLARFAPIMEAPFPSFLLNRTYQDLTRETTPCCLRAEDRHTNYFGMENIDPFLDYRLIEFMFRVPGTMKISHGVTKRLLREAMKGILPEDTRLRIKKTGWNAPAHIWFSGPELGGVRDLVGSRAFRERGIYDLAAVDKILDEHAAIVAEGRFVENHMMFIWQLVNLESWLAEMHVEL